MMSNPSNGKIERAIAKAQRDADVERVRELFEIGENCCPHFYYYNGYPTNIHLKRRQCTECWQLIKQKYLG